MAQFRKGGGFILIWTGTVMGRCGVVGTEMGSRVTHRRLRGGKTVLQAPALSHSSHIGPWMGWGRCVAGW